MLPSLLEALLKTNKMTATNRTPEITDTKIITSVRVSLLDSAGNHHIKQKQLLPINSLQLFCILVEQLITQYTKSTKNSVPH